MCYGRGDRTCSLSDGLDFRKRLEICERLDGEVLAYEVTEGKGLDMSKAQVLFDNQFSAGVSQSSSARDR